MMAAVGAGRLEVVRHLVNQYSHQDDDNDEDEDGDEVDEDEKEGEVVRHLVYKSTFSSGW